MSTAKGVHCQVTMIITAYADVCVARKEMGSNSGQSAKKPPKAVLKLKSVKQAYMKRAIYLYLFLDLNLLKKE